MSDLICPQCRIRNDIDCREEECPGRAGFVPLTWQRPLQQITEDLGRYEALLLECADHFAGADAAAGLALKVTQEAESIRAKQKKEGRADG